MSVSFVKEIFLDEFVKFLHRIKSDMERRKQTSTLPNICFMTAIVDQRICEYEDFMQDLATHEWEIVEYENHEYHYDIGTVTIRIDDSGETKHLYKLEFCYVDESLGYCMCSPGDDGYDSSKSCCGIDCDWGSPTMTLSKVVLYPSKNWRGLQRDYWNFEKKYHEKYKSNESKDISIDKKKEIIKQIAELTAKLHSME